jgi:hypothetical protein
MWIEHLTPERAEPVFGPDWRAIVEMTRALAAGRIPPRPSTLSPEEFEAATVAFGPNGAAVALFLRSWASVAWRSAEHLTPQKTLFIVRVHDPEDLDDVFSSPRWVQALRDAGFQTTDPTLARVFEAGERAGLDVGGPNARWISAAAAGELAQMLRRDLHFFLEMMPWVRAGYWPCGWDDDKGLLKIL